MNVFSGIFFQPFTKFNTWVLFNSKGEVEKRFGIPIKFKELLSKLFEKNGPEYPVQFIVLEEELNKINYMSISVCHPTHDLFSPDLGLEIATGRLKRLMSKKGYKTYQGKNLAGELPNWVFMHDRR